MNMLFPGWDYDERRSSQPRWSWHSDIFPASPAPPDDEFHWSNTTNMLQPVSYVLTKCLLRASDLAAPGVTVIPVQRGPLLVNEGFPGWKLTQSCPRWQLS